MQLKNDGPFNNLRKWVGQFYKPREEARLVQQALNGVHPVRDFPQPSRDLRERGYEDGLYGC